MNLSEDKKWCWCHNCNKQIRLSTQAYYFNDEIKCLSCDTKLGYQWDLNIKTKEEQ